MTNDLAFPKLTTGRVYERLNIADLFTVPSDGPFGNLLPKLIWIQCRVDEVNSRVGDAYASWAAAISTKGDISRHYFSTECAVFQMRRLADELIGLCTVMRHYRQVGVLPERVDPDRLGTLLNRPELIEQEPFDGHEAVLRQLNDLSNAHKHSFLSTDTTMIGAQEPVVCVLDLKNSDTRNPVRVHRVPLRQLVTDFDTFWQKTWLWLKENS